MELVVAFIFENGLKLYRNRTENNRELQQFEFMQNRVHFGYYDMPVSKDAKSTAVTDKIAQQLIDEFILFTAKGVEQNQFKPAYEAIVKKVIPKHNIFVSIEKKPFVPNSMRALKLILGQRKDWEDVFFGFHPVVYVNSYGLFEYTVKISGSPDNLHPGTGKPK